LKDKPEMANFELMVVESVIGFFERRPTLEACSATSHVLRNLSNLFDHVDAEVAVPPALCVRMISCINVLASHNEPYVRTKMKDYGLFHIRDSLVLHCIRDEMTVPERLETFEAVSFEMIGTQSKFHDAGAIAYLLMLFHVCGDTDLQTAIGDILRNQLGQNDDNRRTMSKILQDAHVISLLCPSVEQDEIKQYNVQTTDSSGNSVSWPFDDSIESFVRWYFSQGQDGRRQEIHNNVVRTYTPVKTAYQRNVWKIAQKNKKILAARLQKLARKEQIQKNLHEESIERIKTRLFNRFTSRFETREQVNAAAREARIKQGQTSWAKIREELGLEDVDPSEVQLSPPQALRVSSPAEQPSTPQTPPKEVQKEVPISPPTRQRQLNNQLADLQQQLLTFKFDQLEPSEIQAQLQQVQQLQKQLQELHSSLQIEADKQDKQGKPETQTKLDDETQQQIDISITSEAASESEHVQPNASQPTAPDQAAAPKAAIAKQLVFGNEQKQLPDDLQQGSSAYASNPVSWEGVAVSHESGQQANAYLKFTALTNLQDTNDSVRDGPPAFRCNVCQKGFHSQWDHLCHMRLDH